MEAFTNGKITVTDKSITIKGMLTSSTVMKKDIQSITHSTGLMNKIAGFFNVILISNAGKGIRQMKGDPMVVIKKYNDEVVRFTVPQNDYQKFVESL